LIENCMHFFSFFVFLLLFSHRKKGVIKLIFCMKLKSKYINYNIQIKQNWKMHLKISHSKISSFLYVRHTFYHYYFTLNRIVIISKSVYYNLYIYFLISYKILIWLLLP
jgi:hypothetical protein